MRAGRRSPKTRESIARGCVAVGCLGALAASLAAVVGLAALGVWLERQAVEDPPSDEYTRTEGLRAFRPSEGPEGFDLSFGFADHHGRPHRVTCRVSRADLEAELAAFGFIEDELWPRFNRQIREALVAEARRRRLDRYFEISAYDQGAYRWRWRVEGDVPEPERSRAIAAADELGAWIKSDFPRQRLAMKAALVAPHGFRVEDDGGLVIDYARLAESGTRTLADCQQALVAAGAGSTWRQYLGMFLAFFQELTYEIPPSVEDGRYQRGLWVPTQVLVKGKGDCDSKSVGLSSMLRRFGRRILFILVPRHALIGVEMTPGPGEKYVRLGNRYFVLCDAAGPARIPPGGRAISGDFQYILIEPYASS